jgi:hypothetical protein
MSLGDRVRSPPAVMRGCHRSKVTPRGYTFDRHCDRAGLMYALLETARCPKAASRWGL